MPPIPALDKALSETHEPRSRTSAVRRQRIPWWPQGFARTAYFSGTTLVVGSAATAAFSRWNGGVWSDAWHLLYIGAGVGLFGWIMRIAAGPAQIEGGSVSPRTRLDLTFPLCISLLTWVVAAIFAWSMGSTLHDRALVAAATRQTSATVTDCRPADGDSDPQCTYHWTVDGHAYTQTATATRAWPDGRTVTVWIDPANPGGPVIDDPSQSFWSLVFPAVFGFAALIGLPMVFAEEFVRDDDL